MKLPANYCSNCGKVITGQCFSICWNVFCERCFQQGHRKPCPACGSTVIKDHTGARKLDPKKASADVPQANPTPEALNQDVKRVVQDAAAAIEQNNASTQLFLDGNQATANQRKKNIEILKRENQDDWYEFKYSWTLCDIREKLKPSCQNRITFHAERKLITKDFKLHLTLENTGSTCDQSSLRILTKFIGEKTGRFRSYVHSAKYILVDMSDAKRKRDVVLTSQTVHGLDEYDERATNRNLNFIPIKLLLDSNTYVKDNRTIIKVVLEPIAMVYKRTVIKNGILVWRIKDYSRKLQDEIDGIRPFLTSDSFYTSAKGYRLDLELYLNGFGQNQGKGLSIIPMFRVGEWDCMHSGPIVFNYKRSPVYQLNTGNKSDYTRDRRNCKFVASYDKSIQFADFVPRRQVEKFFYMVDDTLVIKFVIKATDDKSNLELFHHK